jgi:hypothetical protein
MNKKIETKCEAKELQFLSRFCGKTMSAWPKPPRQIISSQAQTVPALSTLPNHLLTDADFKQETLFYITDVGVYGNICIWNGMIEINPFSTQSSP